MNWVAVRTVLAKEQWVERAFVRDGFEASCLMDVRSFAVPKTRRRRVVEVPLLPKIVFARIPAFEDNLMEKYRYVTGLHRDAQGAISIIPQAQMAQFQDAHQAWLQASLKAHANGQPGKARKAKWQPIEALKTMFDPDTGEILEEKAA